MENNEMTPMGALITLSVALGTSSDVRFADNKYPKMLEIIKQALEEYETRLEIEKANKEFYKDLVDEKEEEIERLANFTPTEHMLELVKNIWADIDYSLGWNSVTCFNDRNGKFKVIHHKQVELAMQIFERSVKELMQRLGEGNKSAYWTQLNKVEHDCKILDNENKKLRVENIELKKQLNALDVRNDSENTENVENNEHKTEKDVRKARAFEIINNKRIDINEVIDSDTYEMYLNGINGSDYFYRKDNLLLKEEWNFLKEMLEGK